MNTQLTRCAQHYLDEARAHFVAEPLVATVAKLSSEHNGIIEVIPGGDTIIVEFQDGFGACISGPEQFELHNPYDELFEDHMHLDGPPSDPVDAWTVAEIRADAVHVLIKRATELDPKSDDDERKQRRCLDLAATLAGLVQKGLTDG